MLHILKLAAVVVDVVTAHQKAIFDAVMKNRFEVLNELRGLRQEFDVALVESGLLGKIEAHERLMKSTQKPMQQFLRDCKKALVGKEEAPPCDPTKFPKTLYEV